MSHINDSKLFVFRIDFKRIWTKVSDKPTNPPSPISVQSILELVEGKLKVYIIRNYKLI